MKRSFASTMLIAVTAFAAVSAVGGGIGVVATNGLGIPLAYLRTTPFSSYVIPGLILGMVVGGSALVATILVVLRHPWGDVVSFGAGAIMVGWIIGEILLLRQLTWLQGVYALNGLLMMGLAGLHEQAIHQRAERRLSLHH